MKILFAKETIELTAKEAREAEIYGSEMYRALIDAKCQFPDFAVTVKAKAAKAVNFKGMTREFMKSHIEKHDADGSIMAEFNKLCGLDGNGNKKAFAAVASYGELRMWFLSQYPELADMQSTINSIMDRVRAEKAA